MKSVILLIFILLSFTCKFKCIEPFNSKDFQTYIINLERSQNRLLKISKCLKNANIEFTRIDAIDGKKSNLILKEKENMDVDYLILHHRRFHLG